MVHFKTEDQIKKAGDFHYVKSLFWKYDKDQSGFIDDEELLHLLNGDLGLGVTDEECKALLLVMDKSNTGHLSWEEFYNWWQKFSKNQFHDFDEKLDLLLKAANIFWQVDHDKNGTLCKEEFHKMYQLLYSTVPNMQQLEAAMSALDKDGSGVISFYEFIIWLNWI